MMLCALLLDDEVKRESELLWSRVKRMWMGTEKERTRGEKSGEKT